ncbi:MAG: hypothetical protein UT02_C0013G0010 [Parcubacteria group bacterium GW2011_GWC2_38_7]|nr:MAG: hypothetical protein UT02_C0013G0010 [Parcubacteria group bacterium GW2011_GWC2_38_7]
MRDKPRLAGPRTIKCSLKMQGKPELIVNKKTAQLGDLESNQD